jgi:hypothetical protein
VSNDKYVRDGAMIQVRGNPGERMLIVAIASNEDTAHDLIDELNMSAEHYRLATTRAKKLNEQDQIIRGLTGRLESARWARDYYTKLAADRLNWIREKKLNEQLTPDQKKLMAELISQQNPGTIGEPVAPKNWVSPPPMPIGPLATEAQVDSVRVATRDELAKMRVYLRQLHDTIKLHDADLSHSTMPAWPWSE